MTRARNIAGFSTITTTPSPVHVGPIGVLTATRIDGEFNQVDLATRNITAAGIAATNLQVSGITTGLNVSGIITAQNGINFNGTSTGLNVSGVGTIATLDVNGNGDISGNLTVGGVLTYEDVTRVDSVGVVTAREQVHVGTGVSIAAGGLNVTAGISTFQAVQGTTGTFSGAVSGTTGTFTGDVAIENNTPTITLTDTNDSDSAGIIQHTSGNLKLKADSNGVVGSSSIRFEVDGSEKVRITSGGNFGVATQSPAQKLHVYGNSGTTAIALGDNSTTEPYMLLEANETDNLCTVHSRTNNPLTFKVNNSEKMRIASDGDMGVGTASPSVRLHVSGGDGLLVERSSGTSIAGFKHSGASAMNIYFQNSGSTNHPSIGSENQDMTFGTNNNERARITSDGPHLLLGGTSDVNEITESSSNAGMVIGSTSYGNAGLAIITSTSGSGRLYFGDAVGSASGRNSGGIIYSHSDNALSFRTDDGTAFKAHNGQFEVGTTAGDNGTFAFFNNSSGGNEAGTAGQDGAADKCFHIRADMGPTHLDRLGTDNFTLKLTNQAYGGSGISNPQGTVTKILLNGVTYNGWNAYSVIGMDVQNASGGRGDLYFATGGPSERLRITSGGNVYMGDSVSGSGLGNARGFIFETSGTQQIVTSSTGGKNVMEFGNPNGNVGRITTSGSSTTYYNSSDYRLKENATTISDGITRLKTLIPRKFSWKVDSTNTLVDGFFAHEVTAVPEAISGVKDEVYTEDNPVKGISAGDPLYQMIDQSKLVPLLTAALQEAITKIETLETQVRALQSS